MPLISSFGLLNAINFGLDANIGGGGASNKTLIVAHNVSPYITAYPFDGGFGAKYANPASIPTATGGQADSVTFNATGNLVAVAYSGSPNVSVYNWTAGVGFGSVFSQPATLPTGAGMGVAFNPTTTAISVAHVTTPFVTTYSWSNGFGTKYANPSTITGPSRGTSVSFSKAGTLLSVGFDGSSSPYVITFPWNPGYGTAFASNSSLPTSTTNGLTYNSAIASNPTQIATSNGSGGSGTLSVFNIYTTGWGAKYTDPSTMPPTSGYGVSFNSTGTDIAALSYGVPRILVYPWSAGFGAKYADPSTALPGTFNASPAFNIAGTSIAVALEVSPFVTAYSFTSGVGFGAKLASPTITPTGRGRSIAFSPNS